MSHLPSYAKISCSRQQGINFIYFALLFTRLHLNNMFCVLVKRAYHRLSLKVHPDRVSEKEKAIATRKFQVLSKVYSILSNEEARKLYDETGMIINDLKYIMSMIKSQSY